MKFKLKQGGCLSGRIRVPGDKSISHRSIMFGALAEGISQITGFLEGEDSLNTLRAFRSMGVSIEGPKNGKVTIHGVGMRGLRQPEKALDLGNSGTSMRLLSGLLAAQDFDVTLSGDVSLSKRPMKRVTEPLSLMGARVETDEGGRPPLTIKGGQSLVGISYDMPMASAQVKSCLLLAGLYTDGRTCVTEPAPTRDHTERMLKAFGWPVEITGSTVCVSGPAILRSCDIDVPADISSAAFFMVGASIAEGSDITLEHVGINPTRTGVIDILKLMGANIDLLNEREVGGEPVADIRVRSAQLKGIKIPEALVPLAIDEFPVLFVAAACAEGETTVTGAEELRVKESDRIQVMADGLQQLGIKAEPTDDGIVIQGGRLGEGCGDGISIVSDHDHRISMAFATAALRSTVDYEIDGCDNVNTSFPGFVELAAGSGFQIEAV